MRNRDLFTVVLYEHAVVFADSLCTKVSNWNSSDVWSFFTNGHKIRYVDGNPPAADTQIKDNSTNMMDTYLDKPEKLNIEY